MRNNEAENQSKYTESQKSILRSLALLERDAPKGGYAKAIKKRFFKPKINWSMLAAVIGFAALAITAIQILG